MQNPVKLTHLSTAIALRYAQQRHTSFAHTTIRVKPEVEAMSDDTDKPPHRLLEAYLAETDEDRARDERRSRMNWYQAFPYSARRFTLWMAVVIGGGSVLGIWFNFITTNPH